MQIVNIVDVVDKRGSIYTRIPVIEGFKAETTKAILTQISKVIRNKTFCVIAISDKEYQADIDRYIAEGFSGVYTDIGKEYVEYVNKGYKIFTVMQLREGLKSMLEVADMLIIDAKSERINQYILLAKEMSDNETIKVLYNVDEKEQIKIMRDSGIDCYISRDEFRRKLYSMSMGTQKFFEYEKECVEYIRKICGDRVKMDDIIKHSAVKKGIDTIAQVGKSKDISVWLIMLYVYEKFGEHGIESMVKIKMAYSVSKLLGWSDKESINMCAIIAYYELIDRAAFIDSVDKLGVGIDYNGKENELFKLLNLYTNNVLVNIPYNAMQKKMDVVGITTNKMCIEYIRAEMAVNEIVTKVGRT